MMKFISIFFVAVGMCLITLNSFAATKLVNPEWEFFDDFEGASDSSFWSNPGTSLNYGVNRPSADSKVLEMKFIPNSEGGGDSWSEYDFELGIQAVQVEVSFKMFTPSDYVPVENNDKFFYLFSGKYGHSYANIVVNSEGWGSALGAMPSINVGVDQKNFGHFMVSKAERLPVWKTREGKWSNIQIFLELATEEGDYGYYEIFKDGVLLTATYSKNLITPYSSAPDSDKLIKYSQMGNFIDQGTLLGWANGASNGGFRVDTNFLIDDFRIRANSKHGEVEGADKIPPGKVKNIIIK
ncbi:MAG: hypothetical protein L3J70_08210 [Gammaproteobacteria bacterium]|nr:hypothetical protein [Gammaproteobacteria bacterium]